MSFNKCYSKMVKCKFITLCVCVQSITEKEKNRAAQTTFFPYV